MLALAAAVAVAVPVPAARGQLIAYDGFAYPTGGVNAQNGGTGFTGPWAAAATVQVQAGSLTPPAPSAGLPTTGNSVSATAADPFSPGTATRTLSQPVDSTPGGTFWMSAVMKGSGADASTTEGELVLSDGAGGGVSVTTGTDSNNLWSLSDTSTGLFIASSTVPNTTQSLLVVRGTFAAAGDTFDLYVNPPLTGSPPPSAAASITTTHAAGPLGSLQMSHFAFDTVSSTLFDEVRIGRTFADVTAVPEPSALLLAGAAGVGGLTYRRARRKSDR
jgi:hypothetical protein